MRRSMMFAAVAVALAVTAARADAQATLGSTNAFTSSLATPTGRMNPYGADAMARINAASRAPIPVTSGNAIVRPDLEWVPDRYVPVTGGGTAMVPGHWEQRLSPREVYVPPIVIVTPGTQETIPAGVRPPVDQRQGP